MRRTWESLRKILGCIENWAAVLVALLLLMLLMVMMMMMISISFSSF